MKKAMQYLKGIKTPFLCKLGLHKLTEWSDCYAGYARKYCFRCLQSFNMDSPKKVGGIKMTDKNIRATIKL